MYDIYDSKYGEIVDLIDKINDLLKLCNTDCIEELTKEIKAILGYYGSDNLGHTLQKYKELSEICNKIGCNFHDGIIDEIERLKEVDSKYKSINSNISNLSVTNEPKKIYIFEY